jgi:hypothetical protein
VRVHRRITDSFCEEGDAGELRLAVCNRLGRSGTDVMFRSGLLTLKERYERRESGIERTIPERRVENRFEAITGRGMRKDMLQ